MWKKPVVKAEFSSTGYLQQRGSKGRGNGGGRSPPRRQPRQQVLQAAPKGPPNALAAPPPNEAPAPANLAQPLTFLAADMLKETC